MRILQRLFGGSSPNAPSSPNESPQTGPAAHLLQSGSSHTQEPLPLRERLTADLRHLPRGRSHQAFLSGLTDAQLIELGSAYTAQFPQSLDASRSEAHVPAPPWRHVTFRATMATRAFIERVDAVHRYESACAARATYLEKAIGELNRKLGTIA